MVNQATGRVRGASAAPRWLVAPAWRFLLRYLAVLIIACGIACLYFYQVTNITAIKNHTEELNGQIMTLEQQNSELMVQVAVQNRPDEILREATKAGMAPVAKPGFLSDPVAQVAPVDKSQPTANAGWQGFLDEMRNRLAGTNNARDVAQVGP